MRTKPNSYRHGSYRLGRVYRQGSKTLFHAYDRLLPQSYQYPNFSEGADRVGGQLRGDKEYPFSGVTKSLQEGAGKAMLGV